MTDMPVASDKFAPRVAPGSTGGCAGRATRSHQGHRDMVSSSGRIPDRLLIDDEARIVKVTSVACRC